MRARLLLALTLLLVSACHLLQRRTVVVAPQFPDHGARVLDEQVTLECESRTDAPKCTLTADYQLELEAPSASAATHTHAVDALELRDEHGPLRSTAKADGPPVDVDHFDTDPEAWTSSEHRLAGVVGERRTLHLRAEFVPTAVRRIRLVHSPALTRHMAFSELLGLEPCVYDRGGCVFWIRYVPAGPRAEGSSQTLRSAAKLDVHVDEREHEGQLASRELVVRNGQRVFAPGGPLFGYGVGFGLGEGVRDVAKIRAGWELFAPNYLAHALALELDGRGRVTLAPSVELMSPMVLIFPSLGVGVGVPIELGPASVVGLRGQLSVSLPYLGLLATVDTFPGDPTRRVSPSLFLQLVL